jgi:diacylglycerol kinase family enzyme
MKTPILGIIPNGTGNDFIKSADWSFSLESLYDRIVEGSEKKIDLGILNYGNGVKEYFVNIADAGFGPHVIEKVTQSKSRLGSSLTFATAIIKTFFTFKKEILNCSGESFHFSGPAVAVIAANGRFFGGGLCIAPDAILDDGELDVVIIGNVTVMDFIKYLPQIRRGVKIDHPKVRYYRTKWLEISGEGNIEKDGQMGKSLPVEITVEYRAFRIIA